MTAGDLLRFCVNNNVSVDIHSEHAIAGTAAVTVYRNGGDGMPGLKFKHLVDLRLPEDIIEIDIAHGIREAVIAIDQKMRESNE